MTNEQAPSDSLDDWQKRIGRLAETAQPSKPLVHADNFDAFVFSDYASDVADVRKWVATLTGEWAFRGQRDPKWSLETSIDRVSKRLIELPTQDGQVNTGQMLLDPSGNENRMFEEFRRRAHHFLQSTPADDEVSDWLALMQHYGAPTRMLDWTQSPYVATYFAIEHPSPEDSPGHAIWAVSLDWLRRKSNETLSHRDPFFATAAATDARRHARKINTLLQADMEGEMPSFDVVTSASNLRVNERQAAQQGLFLFTLSHHIDFKISLLRMMAEPSLVQQPVLRKLILERQVRLDLLRELKRMNITGASLFPGLDGFSRGLKMTLELDVEAWKRRIENPCDVAN